MKGGKPCEIPMLPEGNPEDYGSDEGSLRDLSSLAEKDDRTGVQCDRDGCHKTLFVLDSNFDNRKSYYCSPNHREEDTDD